MKREMVVGEMGFHTKYYVHYYLLKEIGEEQKELEEEVQKEHVKNSLMQVEEEALMMKL